MRSIGLSVSRGALLAWLLVTLPAQAAALGFVQTKSCLFGPGAPDFTAADGNLQGDPLFVDPTKPLGADGKPFTADDGFGLTASSPAVNEGTPLDPQYAQDIRGLSRPQGSGWDIGAYEYGGPPGTTDTAGPGGERGTPAGEGARADGAGRGDAGHTPPATSGCACATGGGSDADGSIALLALLLLAAAPRPRRRAALIVGLVLASNPAFAAPGISFVEDNAGTYPGGSVPRFTKYQARFDITGLGQAFTDYNPFNDTLTQPNSSYWNRRGVQVDAILVKPSGGTVTWPMFWEGDGKWWLRYSPTEEGAWSYTVQCKLGSDKVTSTARSFTASVSPRSGFVRVSPTDPRTFELFDGKLAVPALFNGSGTATDGTADLATVVDRLAAGGGNFLRLFTAAGTSDIENPYEAATSLNSYDVGRARKHDELIERCEAKGVYFVYMLSDWTFYNDNNAKQNVYIASGACADNDQQFSGATKDGVNNARQIFQRKIRYVQARWGYSPYLFALEMMNESYGATSSWHDEMASYAQGQSFAAQPHLATTSLGSSRLRSATVDWTKPSMAYVNFHDYARPSTIGWNTLEYDASPVGLEKLGSTLGGPQHDFAVWADRLARLHYKRQKRNKPLIWEEAGLISVDSGGGWHDWNTAYLADAKGEHYRDALWAGQMAYFPLIHWKAGYLLGSWPEAGGSEKYLYLKPLSRFFAGEDLRGAVQETVYPVDDPVSSSPRVKSSDAAGVMTMALLWPGRALLYCKNATHVWFRQVSSGEVPSPASKSATLTISGLTPGRYTLEQWSTVTDDPAKQKVKSEPLEVGAAGTASFEAKLGVSDGDYAYAYKLVSQTEGRDLSVAGERSVLEAGPPPKDAAPPAGDGQAAPAGCGCQTGPTGAGPALGVLAGALLLAPRRRRARPR